MHTEHSPWFGCFCFWQFIPGWWIWYYWFCPVAYSVYGLIASQYGDVSSTMNVFGAADSTVKDYLRQQFGFRHDFLKVVGPIVALWPLLFGGVFIFAIKYLNFQRRWDMLASSQWHVKSASVDAMAICFLVLSIINLAVESSMCSDDLYRNGRAELYVLVGVATFSCAQK